MKTPCAGIVVQPCPFSRNYRTGIQDSVPPERGRKTGFTSCVEFEWHGSPGTACEDAAGKRWPSAEMTY